MRQKSCLSQIVMKLAQMMADLKALQQAFGPTNCNSLKLSLWDSDARAQRESSACLRMSARLFARKKDKPLMFGPQRCTLGLMCPHCNSNLADKSLYGCHE